MAEPTDPELYEKVKKKIREKYGKSSAYASGATVQEYKREGGKYRGKKSKKLNKAIEAVGGALPAGEIKRFVNSSYEKNRNAPTNIDGYLLDKELSNAQAKVYHNPETGKTVIANRGTKGTLQDWANNLAYKMGLYEHTGRWHNAVRTQDEAIKKYGKVDVNVGHSQSGIITRKLDAMGKTGEIINVNPASLGERQQKNETVVRSSLDPVSLLQPNQNKTNVTIRASSYNPLKEHSGSILGRLNPQQMIGI
jgi:hypothetical protein